MNSIHDPPDEVYVVSWVWEFRNSSGGKREVFLRQRAAEERIAQLFADDEYTNTNIRAHRLAAATWEQLSVHPPTEAHVEPSDDYVSDLLGMRGGSPDIPDHLRSTGSIPDHLRSSEVNDA